jgi:hypothetical protein
MVRLTLIAGLAFSAVSGCNNAPAPQSSSSPPAVDLTCPAEPTALTDAQVIADAGGSAERQFEVDAIIAGRACRDALHRVCEWHKTRGLKDVDCDKPQDLVR